VQSNASYYNKVKAETWLGEGGKMIRGVVEGSGRMFAGRKRMQAKEVSRKAEGQSGKWTG
jgi:hypothetical protein